MDGLDLRAIVDAFEPISIVVVGDLMLDRYVTGDAERISPEAPIPILRQRSVEVRPGGAANVAMNLRALGADVTVVGVIGDDDEGRTLVRLLDGAGVVTEGVVVDASRPTTVKARFTDSRQQLLRVDREERRPVSGAAADELAAVVAAARSPLVVSDHGKGVVTNPVRETLKGRGVRMFVDPAPGVAPPDYRGAEVLFPNRIELRGFGGAGSHRSESELARMWFDASGAAIVATLGAAGALVVDERGARHHAARALDVYDVTGAGDATFAVTVRALLAGATLDQAVKLGMIAGSVAVARQGAVAVSRADLVAFLPG